MGSTDKIIRVLNSNSNSLIITFITLLCMAVNLFWYFHQDRNPKFFIAINILTAFTIMLVVLLPAIKQQLKNDRQNKIK